MGQLVIAVYRPRPGREQELLAVARDHLPVLRRRGLVTDRVPVLMRAADGTLVEVFEWKDEAAVKSAHTDPAVREIWGRFDQACEFGCLSELAEARERFPHFEPLTA